MNYSFLLGYAAGTQSGTSVIKQEKEKEIAEKNIKIFSLKMRLFKASEELKGLNKKMEGNELTTNQAITALINTVADCNIIITDTSSKNIYNRHIFVWRTKKFFSEQNPAKGKPYLLKWFKNLWYNYTKTGGYKNGYYYIDPHNSHVEYEEKDDKIIPVYGGPTNTNIKDTSKVGIKELYVTNAELEFNENFPNNIFIKIYGNNSHTFTELFGLEGFKKLNDDYKFSIGPNETEMDLSEIFFGHVLPNNVHIMDEDMY